MTHIIGRTEHLGERYFYILYNTIVILTFLDDRFTL